MPRKNFKYDSLILEEINLDEFKKIEYTNGYYINRDGEIISITINRLTHQPTTDGYFQCHMNSKSKNRYPRVHRLIAQAFIPNPNNLPVVNHINGIKTDNRIENLEWCTHSENSLHSVHVIGNKPPITCQVPVISTNTKTGEIIEYKSISECARAYCVSTSAISKRLCGTLNQNSKRKNQLQGIIFKFKNNEKSQTTIENTHNAEVSRVADK